MTSSDQPSEPGKEQPEQGTSPVQRPSAWTQQPQQPAPWQPGQQQPGQQQYQQPPQQSRQRPAQPPPQPKWPSQQQPQRPPGGFPNASFVTPGVTNDALGPPPAQQQSGNQPPVQQPSGNQPSGKQELPKVLPESTAKWTPPPADAPEVTSVLQAETPETQFVAPPKPEPKPEKPAELPDPGTESLRPVDSDSVEGSSGSGPSSTGTGTGTGSGTFTSSRRTSSRSRSSRRGGLGAGLVDVPPVPYREPASAVMENPVVAENKRFCSSCNAKVGRGKPGEPGPTEGECAKCGAPFSFTPKLQPGDLLGGQYEVLGALAYGGLGWIYLAQDHNVADRWVVLKGLINTGDETAIAAAISETRYLAEVDHPNIVKVFNFVEHPDQKTGTTVGYIVMEYVGGQSLRQLALAHHKQTGRAEGLPIGQVIAYGLEILPALGYLHSQGLLYCDLKPDNVIQTNEQLKLIDMGAVRRIDDYASALFFTSGYSAPELATRGASVQSDLFTVGRTLAVLSFEFTGYSSKYKTTLPPKDDVPLFVLFDSYYRFLKRATHTDPDRRFLSAAEMADQLTGVLREIMALGTGEQRPGTSTVFSAETHTFGVDAVVSSENGQVPVPEPLDVLAGLPVPMVDTDDSAAALLASTTASEPKAVIEALAKAPHDSIEVRLRVVRARVELGELAEASRQLQAAQYIAVKGGFPHDWRLEWYRGLIELAGRRPKLALAAFDAVYDELPGEIAPKLARAVAAEGIGDYFTAARCYELVWRTDKSYVSAAFGLARVYLAQGARDGAVQALESIPVTSTHHTAAQVAAIKIKTRPAPRAAGHPAGQVDERDLVDAAGRLERLALDAERRTKLSAEVLEAAYGVVKDRNGQPSTASVLGCKLNEREVRFGLERCYRALARLAGSAEQRIELVDRANAIRPRTVT
jgi:serine/threonine-protein kinase PknG